MIDGFEAGLYVLVRGDSWNGMKFAAAGIELLYVCIIFRYLFGLQIKRDLLSGR